MISYDGTGILSPAIGNETETVRWGYDSPSQRTKERTQSMKHLTMTLMLFLVVAMATGCVKKSTYEAVLQEADIAKTEIEREKEEQRLMTRQVRQLEQMNAEAMREAEATTATVQRNKDEADKQRRLAEEQQEKLIRKIAQLTRQQAAFEKATVIAKENGAALQDLVDVYQKKVRELAEEPGPASAPQATGEKSFDPAALPPAQELPAPAAALEPIKPQPPPPSQNPSPQPRSTPEPADTGWLDSIKDWLVSIWRSIFS